MGDFETAKILPPARAASVLLALLLLLAACSESTERPPGKPERAERSQEVTRPATPTGGETTAATKEPPKITLGEEPGGRPEVVLRLEGSPQTTFSGLCSVGGQQEVLSGKVPKRFTFDPRGRELSCRIQKRDDRRGALKIVLIAGDTTRSVQQTNSPDGTINVSYERG